MAVKTERKEGWMRIVVGIISGIVLCVWRVLIVVLAVINWLIVVFSGKRNRGLAEMSEVWNTQVYHFLKYMTFVSNHRPFPFNNLDKSMSKYEK